jgi:hypothetical protein
MFHCRRKLFGRFVHALDLFEQPVEFGKRIASALCPPDAALGIDENRGVQLQPFKVIVGEKPLRVLESFVGEQPEGDGLNPNFSQTNSKKPQNLA